MRTPCRSPGCPALLARGDGPYCPEHQRDTDRSYRQRGHRHLYQTKRWRVVSRNQLRAHPLCARCGELATEVDHVVPVEDGGPMWSPHNHESLCHQCHSRKTRDDVAKRVYGDEDPGPSDVS